MFKRGDKLYSPVLIGDKLGSPTIAGNLVTLAKSPIPVDAPRPLRCAGTQPFSELAEQNCWGVDLPTVFTDEGRLLAGLLCAYVVDHMMAADLGG